ncbi:MAG: cation:proton antiporter [Desulfovibrionaceae bacterium]
MHAEALSLLVISLAVAVLPSVARVLRLPAAVVEIAFGVIIGKSVLNAALGGEWLPFLAQLGFLVLMFQAGMEIDFTMLRGQGARRMGLHLAVFAATLLAAGAAARLLGGGVFLALVLSTTSLGLVVPTLRESGLARRPLGQNILIAATLADFLTLLGITFYVLYAQYGLSWRFVQPLPLFAGFALALWAARLWAWWHPERARRLLAASDAQEMGVRLSLALLFVFVGVSELVRIEPVLGAFLGGCILSFVFREKEPLEHKISALGFGFLIPLFFIHVGMGFDVAAVLSPERLGFVGLLFLLALGVKLVPGLLYPLWGLRLRDGLKAGLLLSSRLSLIVAAAAIGLERGFLDRGTKDAVVLLALLTCLAGPALFRLATRREARRAAQERALADQED